MGQDNVGKALCTQACADGQTQAWERGPRPQPTAPGYPWARNARYRLPSVFLFRALRMCLGSPSLQAAGCTDTQRATSGMRFPKSRSRAHLLVAANLFFPQRPTYRERLALERLQDEVADHPAVVHVHARPKRVEDSRHSHFHAFLEQRAEGVRGGSSCSARVRFHGATPTHNACQNNSCLPFRQEIAS